jgi:hypothetical protein
MVNLNGSLQAVMSKDSYWRKMSGRASDWHKKQKRVDVRDPLSGNLCDQYMRERYYPEENLEKKKTDFKRREGGLEEEWREVLRLSNLQAALKRSYEKQQLELSSTQFSFPALVNKMQITGRLGQGNMQRQFCKAWQVKAAEDADLQKRFARKRKHSLRSVEVLSTVVMTCFYPGESQEEITLLYDLNA